MPTLTEGMKNLVADIASSREGRHAWLNTLKGEVRSMRRDMKAWIGSLRSEVGQMRSEFQSDIEQARQVWQGATRMAGASQMKRQKNPARRK